MTYIQQQIGKAPFTLGFEHLDASVIVAFLNYLEGDRHNTARTRNARLAAIRSFFRYAALETPQHSALIQRVLAIPNKRQPRPLVDFLTRPEIGALLAVPNLNTWLGRRDHALLLTAVQTGLRLSEITTLRQSDVALRSGAHVRCQGKGRKERCTPLAKPTVAILGAWIKEQGKEASKILFPSARGGALSSDSVQYLVTKYAAAARSSESLYPLMCSPAEVAQRSDLLSRERPDRWPFIRSSSRHRPIQTLCSLTVVLYAHELVVGLRARCPS